MNIDDRTSGRKRNERLLLWDFEAATGIKLGKIEVLSNGNVRLTMRGADLERWLGISRS